MIVINALFALSSSSSSFFFFFFFFAEVVEGASLLRSFVGGEGEG